MARPEASRSAPRSSSEGRGPRFPGAQSTGAWRRRTWASCHSYSLMTPTTCPLQPKWKEQRELEPKLNVNPSFDTEFLTVCTPVTLAFCHFITSS